MSGEPSLLSIERHRDYLIAIARLQLAARPWVEPRLDASDLVQQTMLKAHAARYEFRGTSEAELLAWLRQILHRTLANELRAMGQEKRKRSRERSLEEQLDHSGARLADWLAGDLTSPSQRLHLSERAMALSRAVDALPDDQRHVILARHCHGRPLLEIAAELDRSPAAIAGLLRRGLASLRQLLDGEP
jgi:RNA polymerase sigma-70 factor (ECF subfamily)